MGLEDGVSALGLVELSVEEGDAANCFVPHPQGHGVGSGPGDDPHEVDGCYLIHGESKPHAGDDLPVVNEVDLMPIWLPAGVQISVIHSWFGLLSR